MPAPARSIEDRLRAAALAAGVAIEQIGLADGVGCEVDDDDQITLHLGEDGDEEFAELDDALERIDGYGDEYGGDRSRPTGAIIDFVNRLNKRVAKVADDDVWDTLMDRFDEVCAIGDKLGLEHMRKLADDDGVEVQADDEGDVGFFEDGNGVVWHVFVDDGVEYKLFGA